MKKIKLFLAAIAAMVTMGANAQSWTASEVGEGYYMLYNVGTGQYLTRGNGWGTQASITTTSTTGNGIALRLAGSGSDFKMFTGINGETKGIEHLSGGTIYTDQAENKNSTWTFTQVATDNGPVYTIVSKDNHAGGAGVYLTAGANGTIVTPGTDGTIAGAQWKLMSIPAQPIGMDAASETNPVDATSLIVNPNFSFDAIKKGDGWTMNSSNYNACGGNVTGSNVIYNPCAESWRAAFTLSQAITVPNGIYELTAQAAVTEYTVTGADLPVVYANDVTTPFTAMTESEQSMGAVATNFTANKYTVGPIRVVVTTGSLTIGVRGTRTDTWCVWDNFKLTYKGLDLSELKAALQAQIDAVPALEGTTTTAAYTAAKNYADGIDMDALTTEEAISTASTELASLVNAATALQTDYANYNAIRTEVLALDDDATVYTGTATIDVSAADAAVAQATTVEAINAAINQLRTVAGNFITSVTVNENKYFDLTNIWVVNPTVSQNVDGWNVENVVRHYDWSTGPTTNFGETEFYQSGFDFNQSVTLPAGTWEFGVTGFHRAGTYQTYFYAGEDRILLPGETSDVVNSMADAQTYFNNGNGKVALKFLLESESNTIKIGILNEDTGTDRWTIFRNFTLKFYGAPDYSVYEDRWAELVEEANTAKAAAVNVNVTGSELTTLNAAIADSPAGSNLKDTYIEKIGALENALQAFNAAAPAYDKYVAYRAETVAAFGETLAATVAAPTSAAEATTAVQNLNIAQYNKVASDYTYSLNGLIGDFGSWEGTATVAGEPATPNYLENEHWSGQTHAYYEQASNGWGNANGWTIQYQKKCTLPAGEYVIKVAARTAGTGVTSLVSCSATDVTITLPAESAYARGIKLNGEAGWAGENSEYARDGVGFGWQWRFLPFTLTEQTEVTMTFYAEASTQYQWMSIADGELLSANDVATPIAYAETANNTIEDVLVANVTITRAIKEGFNTVCLPFTLTANQVTAAFGEGSKVYNFSEESTNPNDATINFQSGDGSITANVPVLVKATEASASQTFTGVQIVAVEEAVVPGTNFNFVGTYAPTSVDAGDYFIGNGALYKSEGNTNMKAFRAYIQDKNPDQQGEVKLFIDDIETSISEINGIEAEQGIIYNIAGQRVNKAQRGIYIVNGKKVIVK